MKKVKDIRFKKGRVPWNKNMKVDRTKFPSMGHFKKNSEETKRKISEATKKAMANPEMRQRLSQLKKEGFASGKIHSWNKGKKGLQISWMKGKQHTEEAKIKMKERSKAKWLNPEYRKYMSEVHKGKPSGKKGKYPSIETLRKLSQSHKGKPSARKGQHLSEEEKKRVSEATKKAMANPEVRKKFLEANIKRYQNPISLKKIKEQSRKTILGLFASGKFPKQTNTKPERQIKEELIKRGYREGIDFIHQFKFMNKFMCDFCFPLQKIIVEVDGDFWHANPKRYSNQNKLHPHQINGVGRDKSKNAYILKVDNGSWNLLRFWESDIKKDVGKCVDEVEKILKKKMKTNAPNLL